MKCKKNVQRNRRICFIILWIYRIAQKETNPQINECNDLHFCTPNEHTHIQTLLRFILFNHKLCTCAPTNWTHATRKAQTTTRNACILKFEKFMANNKLHLIMQFAGTPNVYFSPLLHFRFGRFQNERKKKLKHDGHSIVISFMLNLFLFHRCIVRCFVSGWMIYFCRINTFKLPKLTSRFWWSNWRYRRDTSATLLIPLTSISTQFSRTNAFFKIAENAPGTRRDNTETINFHKMRFFAILSSSNFNKPDFLLLNWICSWFCFLSLAFVTVLLNYHKPKS